MPDIEAGMVLRALGMLVASYQTKEVELSVSGVG